MDGTTYREVHEITVGPRFRRHLGDIRGLADSIRTEGLLHPVVITPDNRLIAGQRRLEAYKLLAQDHPDNWSRIPVHVVPLENIARGEFAENVHRANFTASEMVAIAAALKPVEATAARNRTRVAGKQHGRGRKKGLEKFSTPNRAADQVAKAVGISRITLGKAEEVVQAADAEPQKYASLVEEMDRTGRVSGVHRKLVKARQAEQVRAEPPPLPSGPFRVIVADPPWSYEKRAGDPSSRGTTPYTCMSIEEIKALPVEAVAHEDSILWLWTTNAHLPEAFSVAQSWGFEYKTLLTWAKDHMGMGDWLRGKSEHCLLCVRGKPVVTLSNQTTVLHASVGAHSEKPDEFFDLVETLCPGSKLEMFARRQREGWQTHGLEAPASVTVEYEHA